MGSLTAAVRQVTRDLPRQVEDAHSFAELLPGSRLVVVTDADHNYTNPAHSQQLVQEVTRFFMGP